MSKNVAFTCNYNANRTIGLNRQAAINKATTEKKKYHLEIVMNLKIKEETYMEIST